MDNPETWATLGTRHRTMTKQNKNTTQKTEKDEHQKTGGEPRCSRRLSNSRFLQDTCRVTRIVKSVKSLVSDRGKK